MKKTTIDYQTIYDYYLEEAIENKVFMAHSYAWAKAFCETMPEEAWKELESATLVGPTKDE